MEGGIANNRIEDILPTTDRMPLNLFVPAAPVDVSLVAEECVWRVARYTFAQVADAEEVGVNFIYRSNGFV